jgi:hypothetical protein
LRFIQPSRTSFVWCFYRTEPLYRADGNFESRTSCSLAAPWTRVDFAQSGCSTRIR